MKWITITDYHTAKKRTIHIIHIVSYRPSSPDRGTFIETTSGLIFASETTEQIQELITGDKR